MVFTSDNKEYKTLISRADDVVNLSLLRHKPCFFGFLNEREEYILKNYLFHSPANITFYGGYDGAERKMLCSFEYNIKNSDFPISEVYFEFRKYDKLSHRDFLGSLMALGIERSCVGDIIVNDGCAVCYVKDEVFEYIKLQISKIGRVGVKISSKDKCNISFKKETEEKVFTVSSLRLDVVVAGITGLSREKTASLILSGKVFCNYEENHNVSHKLDFGDILTIRGNGKFIIKRFLGETKKGRLKLLIEHYR